MLRRLPQVALPASAELFTVDFTAPPQFALAVPSYVRYGTAATSHTTRGIDSGDYFKVSKSSAVIVRARLQDSQQRHLQTVSIWI